MFCTLSEHKFKFFNLSEANLYYENVPFKKRVSESGIESQLTNISWRKIFDVLEALTVILTKIIYKHNKSILTKGKVFVILLLCRIQIWMLGFQSIVNIFRWALPAVLLFAIMLQSQMSPKSYSWPIFPITRMEWTVKRFALGFILLRGRFRMQSLCLWGQSWFYQF